MKIEHRKIKAEGNKGNKQYILKRNRICYTNQWEGERNYDTESGEAKGKMPNKISKKKEKSISKSQSTIERIHHIKKLLRGHWQNR